MNYVERLNQTKSHYPFNRWAENNVEFGLEEYTPENCQEMAKIFDDLIVDLINKGKTLLNLKRSNHFELPSKRQTNLITNLTAVLSKLASVKLCGN